MKKKPAKKSMNFVFSTHVYPHDIMVSIDETPFQLRRALKRKGIEEYDEHYENALFHLDSTTQGRTVKMPGNQVVIVLKTYNYLHNTLGIISHEVYHAVAYIMRGIGMEYCEASEEAYAYLHGYIMGHICRKMGIK